VTWLDSSNTLENSCGHGSAKVYGGEQEFLPERRFSALGKIKRCCEKQAKTGPAKALIMYIKHRGSVLIYEWLYDNITSINNERFSPMTRKSLRD